MKHKKRKAQEGGVWNLFRLYTLSLTKQTYGEKGA